MSKVSISNLIKQINEAIYNDKLGPNEIVSKIYQIWEACEERVIVSLAYPEYVSFFNLIVSLSRQEASSDDVIAIKTRFENLKLQYDTNFAIIWLRLMWLMIIVSQFDDGEHGQRGMFFTKILFEKMILRDAVDRCDGVQEMIAAAQNFIDDYVQGEVDHGLAWDNLFKNSNGILARDRFSDFDFDNKNLNAIAAWDSDQKRIKNSHNEYCLLLALIADCFYRGSDMDGVRFVESFLHVLIKQDSVKINNASCVSELLDFLKSLKLEIDFDRSDGDFTRMKKYSFFDQNKLDTILKDFAIKQTEVSPMINKTLKTINHFIYDDALSPQQIGSYIVGATIVADEYDELVRNYPVLEKIAGLGSGLEAAPKNSAYTSLDLAKLRYWFEVARFKYLKNDGSEELLLNTIHNLSTELKNEDALHGLLLGMIDSGVFDLLPDYVPAERIVHLAEVWQDANNVESLRQASRIELMKIIRGLCAENGVKNLKSEYVQGNNESSWQMQ